MKFEVNSYLDEDFRIVKTANLHNYLCKCDICGQNSNQHSSHVFVLPFRVVLATSLSFIFTTNLDRAALPLDLAASHTGLPPPSSHQY